MKKIENNKQPFFAKFLEKQIKDDTQSLKGGGRRNYVTMKYPSDDDEDV